MSLSLKQDIGGVENATHDVQYIQGNNILTFNGVWEVNIESKHLFWANGTFLIHGLAVQVQHYFSVIDANLLIHPEDAPYLKHKLDELKRGIPVDDYFRLVTPLGEIKIISFRVNIEKRDDASYYTGTFNDADHNFAKPAGTTQHTFLAKLHDYAEHLAQYGSWQINLDTHHTIYSKQVDRIFGIVPGSLKAHPDTYKKFIHPDDREIVSDTLDKALKEKLPFTLEYRVTAYDGTARYITHIGTLLNNEAGEELLTGIIIDSTERKHLEVGLQEAQDLLEFEREIYRHNERVTQTGIWLTSLSTRRTQFSENFYRIYGLRSGVLKEGHDSFVNYIYQEDREQFLEAMKMAIDDHVVPQMSFRIFRPDGKLRHITLHGKLINGPGNELVMVGLVQDTTTQEALHKSLKKAHQKHAIDLQIIMQLEQTGLVGNWQLDLQTSELEFSENFFRIYGLKPQTLPVSFDHFEQFIHRDDHKFIKEIYTKIMTERWSIPVEYKIMAPDGQVRHLKAENRVIKSADGYSVLVGTIRDVSENVILIQELENRIRFIELLSNNIQEMLLVTDLNYNIVSCNRNFETIIKVWKEQILEKNIFEVFPGLRQPSTIANLNKALSGQAVHMHHGVTGLTDHQFQMNIIPLQEVKGNVIGILMILNDVTVDTQLREQLTVKTGISQILAETSRDRIIVTDEYFNIITWNKSCENYFKLTARDVLGKNMLDFFPTFKQDPAYENCKKALKGETVHLAKDAASGMSGNSTQSFIPLQNDLDKICGVCWIMFSSH